MTFFCKSVQAWFFSSNAEKLQKQESKVSRQKIGFEQGQKGLNKGLDKLDAAQEGCSKHGFNKIFFFFAKNYLNLISQTKGLLSFLQVPFHFLSIPKKTMLVSGTVLVPLHSLI